MTSSLCKCMSSWQPSTTTFFSVLLFLCHVNWFGCMFLIFESRKTFKYLYPLLSTLFPSFSLLFFSFLFFFRSFLFFCVFRSDREQLEILARRPRGCFADTAAVPRHGQRVQLEQDAPRARYRQVSHAKPHGGVLPLLGESVFFF